MCRLSVYLKIRSHLLICTAARAMIKAPNTFAVVFNELAKYVGAQDLSRSRAPCRSFQAALELWSFAAMLSWTFLNCCYLVLSLPNPFGSETTATMLC